MKKYAVFTILRFEDTRFLFSGYPRHPWVCLDDCMYLWGNNPCSISPSDICTQDESKVTTVHSVVVYTVYTKPRRDCSTFHHDRIGQKKVHEFYLNY